MIASGAVSILVAAMLGQTNMTCKDGACLAFPNAATMPSPGFRVVASSDSTYGRAAAQPCQTGACPITASTQAQPSPTWAAAPFPQYTAPPGTYVPPRVRVARPAVAEGEAKVKAKAKVKVKVVSQARSVDARGFVAGVRRPLGSRVVGGRCGVRGKCR